MLDGSYGSTSSAEDEETTWATVQANHSFDSGGAYDWATSANLSGTGFGEYDSGVSPANLIVGSEAYLAEPAGQPYHSVSGQGSSS